MFSPKKWNTQNFKECWIMLMWSPKKWNTQILKNVGSKLNSLTTPPLKERQSCLKFCYNMFCFPVLFLFNSHEGLLPSQAVRHVLSSPKTHLEIAAMAPKATWIIIKPSRASH
jgi:hypothetical protein